MASEALLKDAAKQRAQAVKFLFGFGVLGFRVFRVESLGFRVWGLGFIGFRVEG